MNIMPYLGIVALMLVSAFFAAAEIAYTSVNKVRLKKAAEVGTKRAKLAYKNYEKYDAMLYTILIANNLVNIFASALATVIAISLVGEAGAGVATLVMTVIVVMFGEIIPKTIGKQRADVLVHVVAYPIRFTMFVFSPIVKGLVWIVGKISRLWKNNGEALPSVTEEEFVAILETAEDEGVIDEERTELLQSVLEFDEITVQEVLTPRMDLYAIDVDDTPEEIREAVFASRYSRLPVYENTIDNIIGILYVNTFLKRYAGDGSVDVRDIIQAPQFIHKTMRLNDALNQLRREHVHVAVVLDEFGGTLGMVTMEDILEELVGEIWDESDDIEEELTQVGENVYECDGSMALHDFFDELDIDDHDFESDYTTVGGWAIEMLDAMPTVGDAFAYKNINVKVMALDGMRVERVVAEVMREDEEDD